MPKHAMSQADILHHENITCSDTTGSGASGKLFNTYERPLHKSARAMMISHGKADQATLPVMAPATSNLRQRLCEALYLPGGPACAGNGDNVAKSHASR